MSHINKVLLAGLTQVGKTSIINAILNKNLDYSKNVLPTKGCNRIIYSIGQKKFSIWDSGGVLKYRMRFLSEPHKFLSSLDEMIYIFDIQNTTILSESFKYLKHIFQILRVFYKNSIHYYILLHKADPKILNSSQIKKNENKILYFLEDFEIPFRYKILKTSIYYFDENYSANQFVGDEKLGIGYLIEKLFSPEINSHNYYFN